MNTLLLIFFALPIAVIIISIALQKIFKCPFLVAAIIFAIFLVVTFIIGDLIFLVATIAFAILAFITAVITKIICRILHELDRRDSRDDRDNCRRERCGCSSSNDRRNRDNGTQLLSIGSCCSDRNDDNDCDNNNSCSCNCNTSNNSIAVRANVFPNNNANGRSRSFCGCFRRR